MMTTMTMLRDKKRCPHPIPLSILRSKSPPILPLSLQWHCVSVLPACRGLSFRKQTRRRRLLDPLQYCVLLLVPPLGFQKRERE